MLFEALRSDASRVDISLESVVMMKRLLFLVAVATLAASSVVGCSDAGDDEVNTDSTTTVTGDIDDSTTSTEVGSTTTSTVGGSTTTSVAASSTSVAATSTTDAGSTSTTSQGSASTKASTTKPTTTETTAPGTTGLLLSDEGIGVVEFGAPQAKTEQAVRALLGAPDNVEPHDTCWGKQVFLSWDDQLSLQFIKDELYGWSISSDQLDGPNGVNVGDRVRDIAAAYDGYRPEAFFNELAGWPEMILKDASGDIWFRIQISDMPADNPAATIEAIEGTWGSEHDRLFTEVSSDPDLWCGD